MTISAEIIEPRSSSLATRAKEAGIEAAMTAVTASAAAIAGGAAGEIVVVDLATSYGGPIATPMGQAAGRVLGKIAGAAIGAAAIRCSSRSASRPRANSQVRFSVSPEPVQSHVPRVASASAAASIRGKDKTGRPVEHVSIPPADFTAERARHADSITNPVDKGWMLDVFRANNEQAEGKLERTSDRLEQQILRSHNSLSESITQPFQTSNGNSLRREREQDARFNHAFALRGT